MLISPFSRHSLNFPFQLFAHPVLFVWNLFAEWIAPAMATYIIDSLLQNETTFINDLNFHILPSANPDGYMYSREHDRYV